MRKIVQENKSDIVSQVSPQEEIENNFVSVHDYKKRLFNWMILFVGALVLTSVALLVNYLVFIPWKRKSTGQAAFSLANSEDLYAFIIVLVLLITSIIYAILYFTLSLKQEYNDAKQRRKIVAAIGFTAGFTDTVGVGSFGVITGLMKGTKTITDDSKLPGTLNAALGIGALIESSLFVSSIKVDIATLLILLAAIIAGTFVGSMFVSKIKDPKVVKVFMGFALFFVGILMILSHPQVSVINTSDIGDKTSLMDQVWRIIVGTIAFFFLGMVQSFGIGLYAPAMATLSFLGLAQDVIFPIMACGSALSMLPASYSFIKRKQYLQVSAYLIAIFSIFGVIAAFMLVFIGLQMGANMSEETFNAVLKWAAVAVIFYVSITMLYEYFKMMKHKNKTTKAIKDKE